MINKGLAISSQPPIIFNYRTIVTLRERQTPPEQQSFALRFNGLNVVRTTSFVTVTERDLQAAVPQSPAYKLPQTNKPAQTIRVFILFSLVKTIPLPCGFNHYIVTRQSYCVNFKKWRRRESNSRPE